jgi:hypothetical protein
MNAGSGLIDVKNLIQSLKDTLHDDLASSEGQFEEVPDYLKPTKKWEKIKIAPIQCSPHELLAVATYPREPEETKINLVFRQNKPLSYSVTTHWQTGTIEFKKEIGDDSELSDLDEMDDLEDYQKKHTSNTTYI